MLYYIIIEYIDRYIIRFEGASNITRLKAIYAEAGISFILRLSTYLGNK